MEELLWTMADYCVIFKVAYTITDSQRRTLQLVNELLMIRDGNSAVQLSDGTSLPKYDTDAMLLYVATDSLACRFFHL